MRHARLIPAALLLLSVVGCDTVATDRHHNDGTARATAVNFTFSMADADVNGDVASVQYDIPAITQSVVDNGAVLLYFREQGTWTAMPYTFGVESEDVPAVDYTITLGFGYDRHFVEVFYEASSGAVDLLAQPDRNMKAVIIEDFGFSKTSIDLSDYEAVKRYFNLPD